ncbi:hypothetical protein Ddye_003651 [Dipteronia dyeriana]|uniref:Reverse transcriptase zinc-binding domain-containing protein n=1 Tax=Dipteronia dyeriana TaxID=168575 RepID=A0AAD9XT76_9ROSI|nr:hypothetical protein Ddye_003651 [Dipteronia dyeriana]
MFSVKSVYKVALTDQLSGQASCSYGSLSWWKKLWNLKLPSKTKFFGWKACKEILPTRLLLCNRGLVESALCPFCGVEPESVEHSLWRCKRVVSHWRSWALFPDINKLCGGCFLDKVLWISSVGSKKVVARFLVTA